MVIAGEKEENMPRTDKERQGWFRELLLEEKRRLWSEVKAGGTRSHRIDLVNAAGIR